MGHQAEMGDAGGAENAALGVSCDMKRRVLEVDLRGSVERLYLPCRIDTAAVEAELQARALGERGCERENTASNGG